MLLYNNIEDFCQETAVFMLFTAAIMCHLIYCIYFETAPLYFRNQAWVYKALTAFVFLQGTNKKHYVFT